MKAAKCLEFYYVNQCKFVFNWFSEMGNFSFDVDSWNLKGLQHEPLLVNMV